MPIPQPPSRQTAAPPAAAGLSRTRSLRRPQATGLPGASTTTTASSSAASTTSRMPTKLGSTTAPAKNTSPTRLPSKPTRAIPSAPARLRTAAPASTSTSSSSTTSATRTAKPPSSSRTHLLGPSAPQAAPPPGTTTTTTRRPSSSSGRPLSSGGVPASPGGSRTTSGSGPTATARGHARTRSTSAVTSAASTSPTSPTRRVPPGTGAARPTRHPLTAAPVLRPPSAQSVQSSSGGSSAGVRAAGTGRAPSGSSAATARAPSRTQREAPAAPASARPRTRDGAAAAAKPAFNTLQQHYSPAKNAAPKPRVAAILAPPASPSKKPANVALSAETSRLQTHLLQLHILHRDAADVSAEWHASARYVLIDTRFAALAADHAELAQITARRAEAANAAALQDWASFRGDNGMTLEEKIQLLDEVLAGVWSLAGESHSSHASHASHPATSRYAQVVRRFERWAQKTAAQVEARRGIESLNDLDDLSDDDEGAAALLLSNENEPLLGASWHEECGQLARRLQGWQRQLEMLGRGVLDGNTSTSSSDREAQPSLLRMLSGCSGLVVGMLEELRVMQQLEREAAEQELAWVRRINAAAGVGGDGQLEGDTNKARAGAIWRAI